MHKTFEAGQTYIDKLTGHVFMVQQDASGGGRALVLKEPICIKPNQMICEYSQLYKMIPVIEYIHPPLHQCTYAIQFSNDILIEPMYTTPMMEYNANTDQWVCCNIGILCNSAITIEDKPQYNKKANSVIRVSRGNSIKQIAPRVTIYTNKYTSLRAGDEVVTAHGRGMINRIKQELELLI